MATTLMIPVLVTLADAISLYGAYLGANIRGIVSWDLFWSQVFDTIVYSDLFPSILKTYFFGFIIGIIGCYKGFNSKKGTEGVGQSANSAVVISSLLVFVIDLLAVQITDVLNLN
jgi:phospholipid/cholesterol/gamma-HCH transport system permease protein